MPAPATMLAMEEFNLRLTEAARVLRLDPRTVRRWAEKRKLGIRRDHRKWHWLKRVEVHSLAKRLGIAEARP